MMSSLINADTRDFKVNWKKKELHLIIQGIL